MNLNRLRQFIKTISSELSAPGTPSTMPASLEPALKELVRHDDWLLEQFSVSSPDRYQQYLLYCDPFERFSVVSFVWTQGQSTPIHNHKSWGAVGQLRGTEQSTPYRLDGSGLLKAGQPLLNKAGDVISFSAINNNDIHKVTNTSPETAISIHVYGANIGVVDRDVFDEETSQPRSFISSYDNSVMPNIWL
jgi:predicted metal-dependent enzyme (double-stranded beta helix superfamily)